jgi:hypothetical protein
MLDYRAHKLFQLVMFPFGLVAKLMFFVFIGIAILIAQWTEFSKPVKIVVGYASMEGMLLAFQLLWFALIQWPMRKMFFWVVDVIPSRGANREEASAVVLYGRRFGWRKN